MKKYLIKQSNFVLIFSFLSVGLTLFGQKSFEFESPLPVEGTKVLTINPIYFGTYESKNGAHLNFEFNDKGMFINTINIQAISKETLRESSTYSVRNEHIFGVTEDSIPYVFQDDNYYFGVRNTVQLIGGEAQNQLNELSKTKYILNYRTANGYTPALIEFKNNELFIADFDYDSEGKIFKKIKEQLTIELPEKSAVDVVLKPTVKEWQKISIKELFPESQSYKKL